MPKTFADLGLPALITDVLVRRGIKDPFPIQATTIPDVLAGRDVAGRAPTGSGKTLAFGLPILTMVEEAKPNKPRALILAPTRELAAQIRLDLAPYGQVMHRQVFAVFGGVRYTTQKEWLRRGVDVLVATPGRLEDLIEQSAVDLGDVDLVAIDEADRMADMGFLPSVKRILDRTSPDRQTLLFSATLDGDVAVLVERYQHDPARHEVGGVELQVTEATHHFWVVDRDDKVRHTAEVIAATGSTIVFAKTRHGADRLVKQLVREGVDAVAMHGGLTQNQRNRALKSFADGQVLALVATDVAARGIHVDDVSTVVHYDVPHGHKDYLHRSGRTARAGASGTVVSLLTHAEKRAVMRMQRNLGMHVEVGPARPELLVRSAASHPKAGTTGQRPQEPRHKTATRPRNVDNQRPKADRKMRSERQPEVRNSSRSQSVYIGNLPWGITEAQLVHLAAKHGRVHGAAIKLDRRGRSRGIGFVTMPPNDASRTVDALNGTRVGGRPLKVRLATDLP